MASLGNPHDKFNSIHVAGTNGKGSVSASIASILGAAGYKVGLTTSPHLSSPSERVVFDGLPINNEKLGYYAEQVKRAAATVNLSLSYFEAITAIAFLSFAFEKVDWAVVETGLGGRLDATNVLPHPRATIIVSIDKDHQHILGESLVEIAREKAGIAKPGSPLICGQIDPEPLKEIERVAAAAKSGDILINGRDFFVSSAGQLLKYSDNSGADITFKPALHGHHQAINFACAISASLKIGIKPIFCERGVSTVFWPGRLEVGRIGEHKVIIDCAHNTAGVKALASYLQSAAITKCTLGFGAIDTKNWREMVDALLPFVEEWHILSPDSNSAVTPEVLADYLSGIGVKATLWHSRYTDFISHLQGNGSEPVVITGSIYMVGGMRTLLGFENKPIWIRR